VVPENPRYVLTGSPGAGKTAVISELRDQGFKCAEDSPRQIIKARKAKGLPPRPPAHEFGKQVLAADVKQYEEFASADLLVFFERGVVDALAGLRSSSLLDESETKILLKQYSYNINVFLFPPWREIYTTDTERDQDFPHAERVFTQIKAWYVRCGYATTEVPRVSVADRVTFILEGIRYKI
jgi:predicted ATPase